MSLFGKIIKRFLKLSSAKKILAVAIIIVVVWFAYSQIFKTGNQPKFQTARVEKGTIISSVTASGNVLTANLVNITTNATGIVKKVYVRDGDEVVKDQTIAEVTLDREGEQKNASFWSSYLTAKNSLDSANAAFYSLRSAKDTAWKKFYDLAVGSAYQNSDGSPKDDTRNSSAEFQSLQGDWLAAEAKSKNQEAVIDQTKASLNSSWLSYQSSSPTITSPVDGIISNVGLVEGMVLSPQSTSSTNTTASSQRVAVIQNDAKPIVSVTLTEIDAPKVKIGQKATITLDSLPNKTFTGKVATVDRIGGTANNVVSYPSIIRLDIASSDILPNMSVNADIILETKSEVLLVPSAAVQTQDGEASVRVLRNNHVESIPVEVGISSDTQTEIISGLSLGDEVITGQATTQTRQSGNSVFTGGVAGGGAFRPGGFGGGQRRQ